MAKSKKKVGWNTFKYGNTFERRYYGKHGKVKYKIPIKKK